MQNVPNYFATKGINSYSDSAHNIKERFHRDAKKVLKSIVQELGLQDGSYEIRSNKAGIAVSGEVTLHAEHLYVQMYESAFGGGGIEIMYRSCKSRKDYSGDQNFFIKNSLDLNDQARRTQFIASCRKLMSKYEAELAANSNI